MAKKLFVGVDLGGTSMRAGVVTKDGEVLALEKRKTKPELGAKEVVARLAETIQRAVKASDMCASARLASSLMARGAM
ncbi:MAG: hypothetical protein HZC38_18605 [Chloroflexi bacterium]|nr:hypothetical protein [Chloroflexota bacterium]